MPGGRSSSRRERKREPLTRILSGEPVGTLFLAHGARHKARKRWIGLTARPRGYYVVDDGARRALSRARRACWRSGFSKSSASSRKGTSLEFATARAANSPAGSRTTRRPTPTEFAACAPTRPANALGVAAYDEVVHRDNLALIV